MQEQYIAADRATARVLLLVVDGVEAGRGGTPTSFLLLLLLLLRRTAVLRDVCSYSAWLQSCECSRGAPTWISQRGGDSHSSVYTMWEIVDAVNNTPEAGPFFFPQTVAEGRRLAARFKVRLRTVHDNSNMPQQQQCRA